MKCSDLFYSNCVLAVLVGARGQDFNVFPSLRGGGSNASHDPDFKHEEEAFWSRMLDETTGMSMPGPPSAPTPTTPEEPTCDCASEDPCLIGVCDSNDECRFEQLQCGESEVCDSFTGLCEDIQNLVPCVAVIDEWDNSNYLTQWQTFRSTYPKRPFCLLVPNTGIQFL